MQVNGSIGRASVSKTEGWGFESLLTCHFFILSIEGGPMKFIEEIKMEYTKVTWPNKEEVKNATIIVAAMSVALSVYLGVFDLIASRLLDMLVSGFGG